MLLLRFLGLAVCQTALGQANEFVVYSDPITLARGEVHNRPSLPIALPQSVISAFGSETMMVNEFSVDIVERGSNGEERQVPLYHIYNHHYILYMGSNESMYMLYAEMKGKDPIGFNVPCWHDNPNTTSSSAASLKSCLGNMGTASSCLRRLQATHPATYAVFGGASGGEYRNNPHVYPAPYGLAVPQPEAVVVVVHAINTVNSTMHDSAEQPQPYSPLLQCPCTAARRIDLKNGTIDGCKPSIPFVCNDWFNSSGNTACSLSTYTGGYRCCENGVFLEGSGQATPASTAMTVYAKLTFRHAPPRSPMKPLVGLTIDVTADVNGQGNIEYTIDRCPAGTPAADCVHTATNVQNYGYLPPSMNASEYAIDLVYAVGHVHTGAISLELVDGVTGQQLCNAKLRYGTSEQPGDEAGYLVGIEPCVWSPPLRLKVGHPLRTVARYNNSEPHTGVMSLWLTSGNLVHL